MPRKDKDVEMGSGAEASGSGSGSEESSSEDELVESMLSTRTKREGAHKKFKASISQYLDVEDVEESYQKMFGEKLGDGDESDEFEMESSSDEDSADSDFSDPEPDDDQAPETQEAAVVDEEREETKKKRQQMKAAITKAPVRRARPTPSAPKAGATESSQAGATLVVPNADATTESPSSAATASGGAKAAVQRMSSRSHSVRDRSEKHKASEERAKLAKALTQKRKPPVKHVRLTQAERLEAAKETEKINLAALDYYTKLQLERKKKRAIKKRTIPNPVRFRSAAVQAADAPPTKQAEKESREYITFGDVARFPGQYFDQSRPQPKRGVCVITGEPANFFDPLTNKPYATMAAFKQLRMKHAAAP